MLCTSSGTPSLGVSTGWGSQGTPHVQPPIPTRRPYLDGEGERHEAQTAEVHVDGVEDGPDEVVAGRRGDEAGGSRLSLVGRRGQVVLPWVGGVHGHGEGHPAALLLHQPGWGSGAGRPLYIALVYGTALSPLYINPRNYSPPRAVVIRKAWPGARRNNLGFARLRAFYIQPSSCDEEHRRLQRHRGRGRAPGEDRRDGAMG